MMTPDMNMLTKKCIHPVHIRPLVEYPVWSISFSVFSKFLTFSKAAKCSKNIQMRKKSNYRISLSGQNNKIFVKKKVS